MRTALILLLILAIAAIPGSLFPQRTADPNGVTQWADENPDVFPVADWFSLFDVYTSPWFSAIYLLLFTSLVGCVIPRIKHHAKALRTRPPRTPARLSRLEDYAQAEREAEDAAAEAARVADVAQKQLRALGYRVERYDRGDTFSVSAERGYLRETGNLLFHLALVGVLITVGLGSNFAYTGQKVIIEGTTFVNTIGEFDSMTRGRMVADEALDPYAVTLDSFDVTYQEAGTAAPGQAGNYSANVSVREPDKAPWQGSVRVNDPLDIAGDAVYLLGNGYAPTIAVQDAEGKEIYRKEVPFLPQNNSTMMSLGIVKVADGLPEQIAFQGFFYPTAQALDTGALTSVFPALISPTITLDVYVGDLGINDGIPRSVYVLDTTNMEQLTGRAVGTESIQLQPGESATLPNGMGTITFVDESPDDAVDWSKSVKRYVSLQVHHDSSAVWVLIFALTALGGLMLALFIPRRRMWVKAVAKDGRVELEYAGLARGEDPTLGAAVADLVEGHARLMDVSGPALSRQNEEGEEDA